MPSPASIPAAPPAAAPATQADPTVALTAASARARAAAAAGMMGMGGTVATSGQGALAPATAGNTLLG